MINYDKIEIGDCVSVMFNNAQRILCRKATVIAMSIYDYQENLVDNTWIFKDFDDHKIHYVSESCTVTLIQKALPTHLKKKDEKYLIDNITKT